MGHENTWHGGRRASRAPSAAYLFSLPSPRRRREDSARWRGASRGATTISGGDEHGSRRDRRRSERGWFLHAFPPSSGTTGVARYPRSGKFASTSSSCPTSLIGIPEAAGASRVLWRLATLFISYCIQKVVVLPSCAYWR
jgi:hypothetical protein